MIHKYYRCTYMHLCICVYYMHTHIHKYIYGKIQKVMMPFVAFRQRNGGGVLRDSIARETFHYLSFISFEF